MSENGKEVLSRADIAAKHLVGNLWYNLDAVALIAGRLNPTIMRKAVSGPASLAYNEMCRLLKEGQGLNAGQLEANLKDTGFDFGWLQKAQADISNDGIDDLYRYAGEVQNASDLLDVRLHCSDALKQANEPGARAETIKAGLLSAMVEKERKTDEAYHVGDIAGEVRTEFEQMRAGTLQWGASTGLSTLDRQVRLNNGDYFTIGARPSQGKTSLMRWMFFKRAEELQRSGADACVLLFSADDTRKKIVRTLASTVAQVDSKKLRSNTATPDEWKRIEDALLYIESLRFFIDDATGLTVEDIHYRTAMQNARTPVVLIGFDYLEKIRGSDNDLSRARASADGCKSIGKVFDCPFVMASQLTKEVESRADKWPTSSDLKYAGEDESDVVLLLNRPEHYISKGQTIDCKPDDESGIVLVNIAKNKEGDVGLVRLGFKKEFARFADLQFTPADLNDY
jgi:replicative DNA helicase